jgi:hypothetical protein
MPPNPTPILRFVHVENLATLIRRGGLHLPNTMPADGLPYRTIHDTSVQGARANVRIDCGPGGTIHDYVPFYFGYLSPMMLKLKTGKVAGYTEGQLPLIYLVTTAQAIAEAAIPFAFSNGHGLAAFTDWFDNLDRLDEVDWQMVNQRYWTDNVNDMDRQRKKQAEFLVHDVCPWPLILEIGVVNTAMKKHVEEILSQFPSREQQPVHVRSSWYY